MERGREAFDAARALGDRWLESLAAGGVAMTCLQLGGGEECEAWLERAASAAMAVASTSMARRLEMWRGAHAAHGGDVEAMTRHYRRAAELAGQKNPGDRCRALAELGMETARIAVQTGDATLIGTVRDIATEVLDGSKPLKGKLPWVPLTHAALALAAQLEGDDGVAADEARAALDIEAETHVLYLIPIMWTAARTLVAKGEPEGAGLAAEMIGYLSFISMSMGDTDLRRAWFANPMVSDMSSIVGFEPDSVSAPPADGLTLTPEEQAVLRDLAEGGVSEPSLVDDLLTKLGVETPNQAIEYAIRSGVSWQ
jgi:hypothetical protein